MKSRKVQEIPKAQRQEGVWRPKRIGNTQGAAETRGWDTKNKYSTQTKKKNMKNECGTVHSFWQK